MHEFLFVALKAIHNMNITCLVYLLYKYVLNALWYMPGIVLGYWHLWSSIKSLATCPEYGFCAFRSTFTFPILLSALGGWPVWIPSLDSLALRLGLVNERHQQETQEQEERGPSPHCYSPQGFGHLSRPPFAPSSCCLLILYFSLPFPPLLSFPCLLWKSVVVVSCGTPYDTPLKTLGSAIQWALPLHKEL